MKRAAFLGVVLSFGAAAAPPVAAAAPPPTAVGFLTTAEETSAELRTVRESARDALKRKGITATDVILRCSPNAECMRDALQRAGIGMGIYVWLWEPTEDRSQAVVGVMLKEANGVAGFDEVAEERACPPSMCGPAIEKLVDELLRRWPERRGTVLSLTGTPRGAAVFDGASLVGTVPGDFELAWGEHQVRIAKQGYEPEVFQVTAGPSPEEARRVDLVPRAALDTEVDDKGKQRRAAIIASGVALLLGGGTLMGLGAASYARSGGCEGPTPCQSYSTTNAGAGVMIGLGVASVGGGLGLLIKGIRDR